MSDTVIFSLDLPSPLPHKLRMGSNPARGVLRSLFNSLAQVCLSQPSADIVALDHMSSPYRPIMFPNSKEP